MNSANADIAYMADDEQEQTMNLEENDNVLELAMLQREINILMERGISPPLYWYKRRYRNLQTYSELGWSSMAQRFHHIDRYIQDTSLNILNNLEELLDEYHRTQHFSLRNYQRLLHDIHYLWTYYKSTYIGNESDPDVGDLIVGLTYMMSNL